MVNTDRHAAEPTEEQIVVFALGGEFYGIGIDRINVIIRMQPVTRVPGADGGVQGVVNHRGSILPVVDLREKLGIDAKEPDKSTRIVVADSSGHSVGLIVDSVTETIRLREMDIQPPLKQGAAGSTYIRGLGREGERVLILLDVDQLLA